MPSTLEIDDGLRTLKTRPPGLDTDLAPGVLGAIAEHRQNRNARMLYVPTRAAGVFAALVIGLAGGGIAAQAVTATPDEIAVLSGAPALAPSTLLGGRR